MFIHRDLEEKKNKDKRRIFNEIESAEIPLKFVLGNFES